MCIIFVSTVFEVSLEAFEAQCLSLLNTSTEDHCCMKLRMCCEHDLFLDANLPQGTSTDKFISKTYLSLFVKRFNACTLIHDIKHAHLIVLSQAEQIDEAFSAVPSGDGHCLLDLAGANLADFLPDILNDAFGLELMLAENEAKMIDRIKSALRLLLR